MRRSGIYSEKLRDPRWQKKRLKILERDGWKCLCCDDTKGELHVHHLVYSKGEPWDAPDEDLETLCDGCHEFREDFNNFFKRSRVPTRFCFYFWSFFDDAFTGENDCAMNCETIKELHYRIASLNGGLSGQTGIPDSRSHPANATNQGGGTKPGNGPTKPTGIGISAGKDAAAARGLPITTDGGLTQNAEDGPEKPPSIDRRLPQSQPPSSEIVIASVVPTAGGSPKTQTPLPLKSIMDDLGQPHPIVVS